MVALHLHSCNLNRERPAASELPSGELLCVEALGLCARHERHEVLTITEGRDDAARLERDARTK